MKIAALFHVSFEKLGLIEDWILQNGYSLREYHLYNGTALPSVGDFDMLIIMGGSMSVNDEEQFPWLAREKELIRECLQAGKPVLGICLGAQLIASAMGNPVFRGIHKEIGWFPVELSRDPEVLKSFPELPAKAMVFHWHGDTFALPADALFIGSSRATPVQAFLVAGKLLALQFHPEIKPENISLMNNHAGDELVPSLYVQDANELSAGLVNLPENKVLLEIFLNYLEKQVIPSADHGNH